MINFSWNSIENASTYQIQIATDINLGSIIVNASGLTTNSYFTDFHTLDYSTIYYWRVRGINSHGNGEWSSTFTFKTTVAAPQIPDLVFPANNALNGIIHQNFEWTTDEISSSTFEIQVSDTLDFSNLILSQNNIVTTSFTIPDDISLTNEHIFFWRLRAKNANTTSEWSSTFTFKVNESISEVFTPNDLSALLWLNSSEGVILANDFDSKIMEWDDQSGNNYNFTQTDSNAYPSIAQAYYNGKDAIKFDPENAPTQFNNLNFVDSGNIFSINGSQNACIAITMIPNDLKSNHCALWNRSDPNTGGEHGINSQFNQIDRLLPYFEAPKNNGAQDAICPANFQDNQLVQNIFNFSGTNLQVWQNGQKVNNETVTFALVILPAPRVCIGSLYYYTNYGGVFAGYLFHVAYFNRTLNDSEIAGLYNWHKQEFGL